MANRFKLSLDKKDEGRFVFVVDNNEPMAVGEGYTNGLDGVEIGVRTLVETIRNEPVVIEWPDGRSEEL
jgi:uncharacterized protein YegP (UPF0339 family)